jgi:hypothetical protein
MWLSGIVCGIVLAAFAARLQAFETVIQVSPASLNIGSSGKVVTVHTEVAYASVVAHSVSLNGIPIQSWKADDRGNFVAKFNIDAVKTLDGLVIGGDNELILIGATIDNDSFIGSDWVRVVDILPSKR